MVVQRVVVVVAVVGGGGEGFYYLPDHTVGVFGIRFRATDGTEDGAVDVPLDNLSVLLGVGRGLV